ncbi:MAG: ice-binding family protein [Acidimicrobiales bacterium]
MIRLHQAQSAKRGWAAILTLPVSSINRARHGYQVKRGRLVAASMAALTFMAGVTVFMGALADNAQAAVVAVPLGTAGSFAVLGGSGLTNSGTTTISGDVGSYPTTSETGFGACPAADCVALTGTNEAGNGATQQAKTDLTTAYNTAAGEKPSSSAPANLGGQTLAAGVYNSASSLSLTGTVPLTLNGGGNPNAVFVFQAGSTLTTGSASKVSLINDAQACNVFWQIGSSATLGSGSTFRGTILASASISLADSVIVDGRLLAGEQASGAGAVTLIGDTITTPVCAASSPTTTTTTVPTTTPTTTVPTTTTTTTVPTTTPSGSPGTGGTPPHGRNWLLIAGAGLMILGIAGVMESWRRRRKTT